MAMIKNTFEIEQLRKAARIAAEIVDELGKMVAPGVSAMDLENRAQALCKQYGVAPTFLGHEGYQWATCINVSDEVLHAIPHARKVFREGDLVKIDFGAKFNGYCSDHCRTFIVGQAQPRHEKLLQVGEAATLNAVALATAGNTIGDLGAAMEKTATEAGFSIVKTYVGHGIGKNMHEPPEVPAFGKPGTGLKLEENMVLCIECQVCEGSEQLVQDRDGWTMRTKDGGFATMFEHMVRVTKDGPEVLTALT